MMHDDDDDERGVEGPGADIGQYQVLLIRMQ